jgi:hypothetical protein
MSVTVVAKMLLNAWSSVVLTRQQSVKWKRTDWDVTESCSYHGSYNSRSRVSLVTVLSRMRWRQLGATLGENCLFKRSFGLSVGPHVYLFGKLSKALL